MSLVSKVESLATRIAQQFNAVSSSVATNTSDIANNAQSLSNLLNAIVDLDDWRNGLDAEGADLDTLISTHPNVQANTAKVSATGSVTTHNDVTSAGSGQIITSAERTLLQRLTRRTQPNNTATIALYTAGGTYRADVANAATDYTVTIDANAPKGAYDEILINAASEPTVNGSSTGKITGATFAPDTDMYLVIRTPDGTNLEYFFLEI